MRGEEAPQARVEVTSPSSPLRNAQFRWLLGSNLAFFMALHGQAVVRSWLAFELTGSKLALGQIAAAVALPMLLCAPFGGVIADRVERRGLIHAGQSVVLLSESTLLILLWTGRLQFWHLLCGTLVMGVAFPMIMPARQAIVVNLVGRDGLTQAMALSMGLMNATRVVGPLLSGPLIDALGTRLTYAVGVAWYATAMLCLLGVRRSRAAARVQPASVLADIKEGVAYMRANRIVGLLLLFGLIPMCLAMPAQQLLVVFAEEVWKVGSSGFGVLQAISGIGGVAGAIWVARLRTQRRLRRMIASGFAFAGLLSLFALSPWFWPAVLLGLLAYSFASVFGTLNNTAVQLLIPDDVRGRVSSFMLMSISLPLLGTLPVGALADVVGAPYAVASACALGAITVLLFWLLSPTLRSLDERIERAEVQGSK